MDSTPAPNSPDGATGPSNSPAGGPTPSKSPEEPSLEPVVTNPLTAAQQAATAALLVEVPETVRPAERPPPELIEGAFEALIGEQTLSRTQSDLMRSMLATLWVLSHEGTGVGDLKIADAALAEMSEAFRVFRPYRAIRKITMFGSARTLPEDPVYVMARELAARIAEEGWMVVTGAGPGIMAAGIEGAGTKRSFGVNIRLPHEQGANPFIAQDPKLVEMRYFFTRKLMLIKESHAYAVLPGGFGTQDECYELLTLLQTGKAEPAPVVLVETHGGTYWKGWERFLADETIRPGWVSPDDVSLFRVVDTVEDAVSEILHFYRNYHSCRWVGNLLVLRLNQSPSQSELRELTNQFRDILSSGAIRSTGPLPPERSSNDFVDLPRVSLRFDRIHYGRLRMLIDALNNIGG